MTSKLLLERELPVCLLPEMAMAESHSRPVRSCWYTPSKNPHGNGTRHARNIQLDGHKALLESQAFEDTLDYDMTEVVTEMGMEMAP